MEEISPLFNYAPRSSEKDVANDEWSFQCSPEIPLIALLLLWRRSIPPSEAAVTTHNGVMRLPLSEQFDDDEDPRIILIQNSNRCSKNARTVPVRLLMGWMAQKCKKLRKEQAFAYPEQSKWAAPGFPRRSKKGGKEKKGKKNRAEGLKEEIFAASASLDPCWLFRHP